MQTFDQTRRKIQIAAYLALIPFGVYLAYYPLQAVAAFALIGLIACAFFWPKLLLIGFGVFVLAQDLLVYRLGRDTVIGAWILKADEIFILGMFLFAWGRRFIRKKSIWKRTPVDLPLICLIGIAIISTMASGIVPFQVAIADLFILVKGWLIFHTFTFFYFTDENIKKILQIFLWCGLAILGLGIVDILNPEAFRVTIGARLNTEFYRFGIPSVQSIFIHPGEFAFFMSILACFCLAYYIFYANRRSYWLFTIFLFGAILSMRRKPLISLSMAYMTAVFLNVFFFQKFTRRKKGKKLLLGLCFVCALITLAFSDKIVANVMNMWDLYANRWNTFEIARNVMYITGYRIATDYFPFGSGFGSFGGWIAQKTYSPLYYEYGLNIIYGLKEGGNFLCDTQWPYIIGQFGFIGAIVFLWLIYCMFKIAWKGIKYLPSRAEKTFALGTLLILIVALVESLACPVFLRNPYIYFIFGSFGVLYSGLTSSLSPSRFLTRVLLDNSPGGGVC